jgi:hypothetical protein
MAEAIGIASGLFTLAGFALKSTQLLCEAIRSFQSSKREVRQLKEGLEDLVAVLASLQGLSTEDNPSLSALKSPLLRCGRACEDFGAVIVKCAPHADEDRKRFRDWAKLTYMGDDIEKFKNMLEGYKSTICIALADANL